MLNIKVCYSVRQGVSAGELASSSSSSGSGSSFLGGGNTQASSASSMNLAVASFPLSFLMPNCSALQALDQQVAHMCADTCCAHADNCLIHASTHTSPTNANGYYDSCST